MNIATHNGAQSSQLFLILAEFLAVHITLLFQARHQRIGLIPLDGNVCPQLVAHRVVAEVDIVDFGNQAADLIVERIALNAELLLDVGSHAEVLEGEQSEDSHQSDDDYAVAFESFLQLLGALC